MERYENKEVSIMGGEPELDVWVGRKGTIPIPDEPDCESISRGNLPTSSYVPYTTQRAKCKPQRISRSKKSR